MKHHPMTKEQREILNEILNQDLATIMQSLGDIATLLNACYGSKDPRVARAEEAQAALQRFLWALERKASPSRSRMARRGCEIVQMDVKAQE
jgi:DNA topoisomerase VI subunit A